MRHSNSLMKVPVRPRGPQDLAAAPAPAQGGDTGDVLGGPAAAPSAPAQQKVEDVGSLALGQGLSALDDGAVGGAPWVSLVPWCHLALLRVEEPARCVVINTARC